LLTRIPSGMHDVTIEQQYVKRTWSRWVCKMFNIDFNAEK
jgi:hypothetical protein